MQARTTGDGHPLVPPKDVVVLDGASLTLEDFMRLRTGEVRLALSEEAWQRVEAGRRVVDDLLERKQVAYGINTGFGNFANVLIPPVKLRELQENLIRSHAAGTGEPLTIERTRGLMVLRINVLAKGFSGISRTTLERLIEAFNKSCLSQVPEQGTVGASGDLAPLSHLALGLMGEGDMWDPLLKKWAPAAEVLNNYGLCPLELQPKEGLALINGTQLITSLGAEALARAINVSVCADGIAALTLEALRGTPVAFREEIHAARPHDGQIRAARNLRAVLLAHPSTIHDSHRNCGQVQDSYSLRCIPQVHGIAYDTIQFVKKLLETEMNSSTDNPMILTDSAKIVSGGNFHGEYPAKALDYLAIGIHELASISERRIERLVNPALSNHLPAFLVQEGGLNSGFMIAHCTAAALVSENKALCHPASVDSIPTSAGKEDHVSMGGYAARKAVKVVEHVEKVLAIELLATCQALEFLRPLRSTEPLEKLYDLVRTVVAPFTRDRYMKPDIDAVHKLIYSGQIDAILRPYFDAPDVPGQP